MKKSDIIKANIETMRIKAQGLVDKEGVTAEELKQIQNDISAEKEKLEVQLALEEDLRNKNEGNALPDAKSIEGNKGGNSEIFAKALMGKASNEELAEIKNLMQTGEKDKGGLLVPADVKTKIVELQRKSFDIRNYIATEPTSLDKGSRIKEKNEPEATGFASTDEGKEIQKLHDPTLEEIEFAIRKYAGYIPITNELLDDSPENVLAFVTRWMARNELNTYAYQVFNGTGNKSAEGILTEIEGKLAERVVILDHHPTLQDFKDIFNRELEEIDTDAIKIFVNGEGYSHTDGMLDGNGRPYLQPDATKKSGSAFLGHEIIKVPTKFMGEVIKDGKTYIPYIIGDLELLYTMYDRKKMTIESTKVGGEAWRNDTTEVKGIFRFDGRISGDLKAVSIILVEKGTASQFTTRRMVAPVTQNNGLPIEVLEATMKGNQEALNGIKCVLEKMIDSQMTDNQSYEIATDSKGGKINNKDKDSAGK